MTYSCLVTTRSTQLICIWTLILPHYFYPVTLFHPWLLTLVVIWFCAIPALVRLLVELVVGWLNMDSILPKRLYAMT